MKVDMEVDSSPSLRVMSCEQDLLSAPDGSAQLHQGDTSVLCAVYGPVEVRMAKEILDRATIDIIYKPKTGLPGCEEKYLERILRNICETAIVGTLHPRTAINVILQEFQNSGSYVAACVNSICLALLDSGVPMNFTVAAVQAIMDKSGNVIVDPVSKQEEEAEASFTFVFDSIKQEVLAIQSEGVFTDKQFQQCLKTSREASKQIFEFYRDSVKRKLSKTT